MTFPPSIILSLFFITTCLADDFLHFQNKDRLTGTFTGFNENLSLGWKHESINSTVSIEKGSFEKIIINKGYAKSPLKNHSYITLHTGEILPAAVYEMDSKTAKLKSEAFQELSLPIDFCKHISFEPRQKQAIYIGPYSKEHWIQQPELSNRKDGEEFYGWRFNGTSWTSEDDTPLFTNLEMPESFSLKFKLEWENQIYLSIAMLCDPDLRNRSNLKRSKEAHGIRRHPYLFGDTYTISFIGNHLNISRVEEKNDAHPKILHTAQTLLLKKKERNAFIKIDYDSKNQSYSISVDGEKLTQWTTTEDKKSTLRQQLGFSHTNSFNKITLSDVSIRPWSDRKRLPGTEIKKDHHQVILDDQQGQIGCETILLNDDVLTMKSSFGDLETSINNLKEITFAKSDIHLNASLQGSLKISFYPLGFISGTPTRSANGFVDIEHHLLGDLRINENYISSIETMNPSPKNKSE